MGSKGSKEEEEPPAVPIRRTQSQGSNITKSSGESRRTIESSRWPGQAPRQVQPPPSKVRKEEQEDFGNNSYNLLDLQTPAGAAALPRAPDQESHSPDLGGAARRFSHPTTATERESTGGARPRVNNLDLFNNITDLREKKHAKENRPPPPPFKARKPPSKFTGKQERPKPREDSGLMTVSPPKGRKAKAMKKPTEEEQRRMSDISTLELSHSPEHFRKIKEAPKFSRNMNEDKAAKAKAAKAKRSKSSSPPRNRGSKVNPVKAKPKAKANGIKTSESFTNITAVASKDNVTPDSAGSNFNERTRVVKFKDKQDSLANAGLAQTLYLSNQFTDQRVNGQDTYWKAKHLIESEEWDDEVKGMETLVSIAKDAPEVIEYNV